MNNLEHALREFDEQFINSCLKHGLSLMETQSTLLESPQRKMIVDSMIAIEQAQTTVTMIKD